MDNNHQTLVYHTFQGGRFQDHGIDLDVLEDLLRYRTILVEVAIELWKRNHPDRKHLPRNFEESLNLKFYEVQPNCASIPLARPTSADSVVPNELDQAIDLVTRTVRAAGLPQMIPEDFPKHLLGLFEKYGSTLRPDEWIEQRPVHQAEPVRYDSAVQTRLTLLMTKNYEAHFEIIGSVTMARVSKPRLAIQIADGREMEASFEPGDKDKIISALKDNQTSKIQITGRGQYDDTGRLLRIIKVDQIDVLSTGEPDFDPTAKPIWKIFEEVLADVPPEEFDKLPVDGAENLDHYLYGAPRKGE